MKKIQTKYISRRQTKNERTHERIQKNLFQQCVQKIKENNGELKSIEVDVVTKFNKDEVRKFLMLKFILMMMIMMMTLGKIEPLDLDKMCVTSNIIFSSV